jgi:putative membrane protein
MPLLVIYAVILTFLLSLFVDRGALSPSAFIVSLATILFVSIVISLVARLADSDTISTLRRTLAALFAGGMIWMFCVIWGLTYSLLVGNGGHPLANAVIFGAFACGGFEFIVINGAFVKSMSASLLLASLHPLLTGVTFGLVGILGPFSLYSIILGFVVFVVFVCFIATLKRHKTSWNYDSVGLFQAFMKTWVAGKADDLETVIAKHAETKTTSTKVLRFQHAAGNIFIVLPGVHPGPFHPVGSYNLPGLIFDRFAETGPVLTLHAPGGHEMNLVNRADTEKFVSEIHEFARSIETTDTQPMVRGPMVTQIGSATITSFALANDALLAVSFAPLGSDDLQFGVQEEFSKLGRLHGFEVSVVDAHNSIAPKLEELDAHDPGWKRLFDELSRTEPIQFRVGYANSHELGISERPDITDGGIGLLLFEINTQKWALVLADSNNAAPPLRKNAMIALETAGYRLLELCTSDSHNLAARGLTVTRGYLALGEATPVEEISKNIVELAKLADGRLTGCRYGSGTMIRTMNTFGAGTLDEFERVTNLAIAHAKNYSKFAVASILILLTLSIIA